MVPLSSAARKRWLYQSRSEEVVIFGLTKSPAPTPGLTWVFLHAGAGVAHLACRSRGPAGGGGAYGFSADSRLLDDSLGVARALRRSGAGASAAAAFRDLVEQVKDQGKPEKMPKQCQTKNGAGFASSPKALGNGGVSSREDQSNLGR